MHIGAKLTSGGLVIFNLICQLTEPWFMQILIKHYSGYLYEDVENEINIWTGKLSKLPLPMGVGPIQLIESLNRTNKNKEKFSLPASLWVRTGIFSCLHNRTWTKTVTIDSLGSQAFWLSLKPFIGFFWVSGSLAIELGTFWPPWFISQFFIMYLYLYLSIPYPISSVSLENPD